MGLVVAGSVVQGLVRKGDKVRICPSDVVATVLSLEMDHAAVDEAAPGDRVGLALKGCAIKNRNDGTGPRRGSVLLCDATDTNYVRCATSFVAGRAEKESAQLVEQGRVLLLFSKPYYFF